jgi:hypothetical protein
VLDNEEQDSTSGLDDQGPQPKLWATSYLLWFLYFKSQISLCSSHWKISSLEDLLFCAAKELA